MLSSSREQDLHAIARASAKWCFERYVRRIRDRAGLLVEVEELTAHAYLELACLPAEKQSQRAYTIAVARTTIRNYLDRISSAASSTNRGSAFVELRKTSKVPLNEVPEAFSEHESPEEACYRSEIRARILSHLPSTSEGRAAARALLCDENASDVAGELGLNVQRLYAIIRTAKKHIAQDRVLRERVDRSSHLPRFHVPLAS